MNVLLLEVQYGFQQALNNLLPKPAYRIPITWRTFPSTMTHMIPIFFMAYLARRPDTYAVRLLMLPLALTLTIRCTFAYQFRDPTLNFYNWGRGLFGLVCIGKALDLAFAEKGLLKVGESEPGVLQQQQNGYDSSDEDSEDEEHKPQDSGSVFPLWLRDTFDAFWSLRGIGWEYGRNCPIPKETRSHDRTKFILQTVASLQRSFLIADFADFCIKQIPRGNTTRGATLFIPTLPVPQRYLFSTAVYLVLGIGVIAGIQVYYDVATLGGVVLFGQRPEQWPPVQDNPLLSTSVHEFWGKRWHQIVRRLFFVYGGYLGDVLGGRTGLVLGTFLASGLYHEIAMYAVGRGLDVRVILFFFSQGLGMVVERLWTKLTGKRVGGWAGRIWGFSVVAVCGQVYLIESLFNRGFTGCAFIPVWMSPTRKILLPLLRPYFPLLRG